MPKFINPFTDVGFKRIFGQEINKDLLIDFLNSLFAGEKHICDIRFLDKEIQGEAIEDRSCIYDIHCTDENGEQFIVEMQNRRQAFFRERAIYYLARAISRQGERGVDWQFNLKAVYGIFFMNFKEEGIEQKLRTDVWLDDRDTHKPFSDKLRFIFLQLPFFDKEENECNNDFERWIYVLKNMETLQRLPFKARNAVFQKLEEIVDIASLSKEDRMKYDESIKVYRDQLVTMEYERQKGKAEGFAEGKAEGEATGFAKGKAEGREEGKEAERLRNARGMKAAGIAPDLIAQITGLPLETVEGL